MSVIYYASVYKVRRIFFNYQLSIINYQLSIINYRYYTDTLVGDKWLCVAVKYINGDAFLLTAYLTNRIKKGELLWQ